jgi:hypothetical protein
MKLQMRMQLGLSVPYRADCRLQKEPPLPTLPPLACYLISPEHSAALRATFACCSEQFQRVTSDGGGSLELREHFIRNIRGLMISLCVGVWDGQGCRHSNFEARTSVLRDCSS